MELVMVSSPLGASQRLTTFAETTPKGNVSGVVAHDQEVTDTAEPQVPGLVPVPVTSPVKVEFGCEVDWAPLREASRSVDLLLTSTR